MGGQIELRRRDKSLAGIALVDDADYPALSAHRWYCGRTGYAMRGIPDGDRGQHTEYMHRRVLGLEWGDPRQVDHIDGNRLDNRRANLRIVTQKQNNENVAGGRGKSGVRNVYWDQKWNIWRVRLTHAGRTYQGGSYHDLEEARAAAVNLRGRLLTHADRADNPAYTYPST